MIRRDLHTHTTYSDGNASPEEMVLAAIRAGFDEIGISDHSYTFFDTSYCLQEEKISEYLDTVRALDDRYSADIRVLCGIEQDYYSASTTDQYDYVIGSVHYLYLGGKYIPVDENPEILKAAADEYFDGDIYGLCAEYYKTVSDVAGKTNADIIGHFDLISKFNDSADSFVWHPLFDPENPAYISAWKEAADILIATGKPFEINTGAISRGYKKDPYPSYEQIAYIRDSGGIFVLSSDAHSPETIGYLFEELSEKLCF